MCIFINPKKIHEFFLNLHPKYKGQPTIIIEHVPTLDLLNIYIGLNGGAIGHVFST
jgi:hypothetical protein